MDQNQILQSKTNFKDDDDNDDQKFPINLDLSNSNFNQFHTNFSSPNIQPSNILNKLQEYLIGNVIGDLDRIPTNTDYLDLGVLKPKDLANDKIGNFNPVICMSCQCRFPFVAWPRPPFNEVITGGVSSCLPSCYNPTFANPSDQTFATFWLGVWAVLCALSTLITVATFLANPSRFQYPERPIIYLSACYFMIAIGYIVRVIIGHKIIACDGPVIRRSTTGPAQCSIVFILTYVFGMAASVWWVVLTLTWFLAAGLKWGTEAIAKYSQVIQFLF